MRGGGPRTEDGRQVSITVTDSETGEDLTLEGALVLVQDLSRAMATVASVDVFPSEGYLQPDPPLDPS